MCIMGDMATPSSSAIRDLLTYINEPLVLRGFITWKILEWNLNDWIQQLGDKALPFREGCKKASKVPQWEGKCRQTDLTMKQFVDLAEKVENSTDSSRSANAESWWYFDYKYLSQWLAEMPEVYKTVTWEAFGFPERDAGESSIWIGSDGAHTPCHMDTYGSNLVAQVFGTKQWILFKPSDYSALEPTRVPYEESSVYSKHNFYSPDITALSGVNDARVIKLHPGDVLFVPYHWWHYVENVGTAISINTWVEMFPLQDHESRVEESLVKLFVTQLCRQTPHYKLLVNPNEDAIIDNDLTYYTTIVETCVKRYHEALEEFVMSASGYCSVSSEVPKRCKLSCDFHPKFIDVTQSPGYVKYKESGGSDLSKYGDRIARVPTLSAGEFTVLLSAKRQRFECEDDGEDIDESAKWLERIINSFCHPRNIAAVRERVYNDYKERVKC